LTVSLSVSPPSFVVQMYESGLRAPVDPVDDEVDRELVAALPPRLAI
jgi:hypothetical protein